MQGIFVRMHRCKTKKALREAIEADPSSVTLQATSVFGNEYDGPLSRASDGTYYIVGPDPYRERKWYATIIKSNGTLKVK